MNYVLNINALALSALKSLIPLSQYFVEMVKFFKVVIMY